MLLGFLVVFFTRFKQIYNVKKVRLILFLGFIFLMSLLVSSMNGVTIEYILYFACFGITTMLVPVIKNFRMVMRCILFIGVLLIWPYVKIDYAEILRNVGGLNENVAAILMDISYKTLVFVITGIVLAVTDESKTIKIVAIVTAIVFAIIAFVYGARGALLSIAAFLLVFWIIKSKDKASMNKRTIYSVIIIIFLVLLFVPVIMFSYDYLEAKGIEARSLERIYYSISGNESLSEGREFLYSKAKNGIADSPFWGHGIGSFDNYSGVYPHNIILQLLYEGGIILAFPLLYILCRGFISLFSFRYDQSYRFFMLLLFCSGIIELFLSSHLWMSIFFWLFIGQTLIRKKYIKNTVCQKNV